MQLKPKTIVFILLGLLAIYIMCNTSGFKSTFGFGNTTFIVPPGTASISIPIKDGPGGNNLGTTGNLLVPLTSAQYTAAGGNPTIVITAITIPSVTATATGAAIQPTITYSINGALQPPVNLGPGDTAVSRIDRRSPCILPTERARKGYTTDKQYADTQCNANNYSRGADKDPITCPGGTGVQYMCLPNLANVILTNTYSTGTTAPTVSLICYDNRGITAIPSASVAITNGSSTTIQVATPGYFSLAINGTPYNYRHNWGTSPAPTNVSWTGVDVFPSNTLVLPISTVSVSTTVAGLSVG